MNKTFTPTNGILYYANGNEVLITDSGLKVKNTLYQLDGISGHSVSIVAPARVPYILLITMSVILFFSGVFNILPPVPSTVAMACGAVLFATGLLVVFMKKEKYAVKIITSQGEKNVLISQSHAYVSQIVDALNRASLDLATTRKRK